MKIREVIKLLEADGWRQVRMRGSHRQFHHPAKRGTVTVAGKLSADLPPGTLSSVLKQAGLKPTPAPAKPKDELPARASSSAAKHADNKKERS